MSIYQLFKSKNAGHRVHRAIRPNMSQSLYLVYASQFVECQNAIKLAKETFSQEQIWPDQCDYLLHKFWRIQKTANSIAKFANSMKKDGSQKAGNNLYPLMVSAHYFYDQLEIIAAFIQEYKEIAENRFARRTKQRLVISSLHNLDTSLDDLMKELDGAIQSS
jgi:hypothetical protein